MMRTYLSSEILQRHFQALKKNDGLSLRGLAKLCKVSPALLSQVLNSKKLASRRLALALSDALDLDALAKSEVLESLARDIMAAKGITNPMTTAKEPLQNRVRDVIDDDRLLLKSWLHMAVLESTGCDNFTEDAAKLAKRFSVKERQIQLVLEDLIRSGFLVRDENRRLHKSEEKMRIPTNRSRPAVREFHGQMLKKAANELTTRPAAEAFHARLITGYTVAVNPEHLEQAKLILHHALLDIAELLSTGDCERVYQIQAQLFPLDQ